MSVSLKVSLMAVRASALQAAAKDPDAKKAARTIRALSVDPLDELQHMVTLQPTVGDQRQLIDTSAVDVEMSGAVPPDIPTPAQRTIYRTEPVQAVRAGLVRPGAGPPV
ncbi:hypothetical protein ABZS88_30260 [Streptomyces sp. NPDC005480]|uniref:hypothetical protein n=1 Tax=Streptomyces sp. NPDC005480 TaxID=3154880 RepID=UPI0033BC9C2F